jgi:hypothetical protein
MMSQSSRHDKIAFLYTLITHYQNTNKKLMTIQSLYSLY